jgi:NADPH:quinone reductase-like Zn-dependent oxidoreductase
MKAVQIHQYGGRDALTVEEIEIPEINADDLLVRVVASSVNPVDWKIREGYLKDLLPHHLPLTLGWDVAGIVEKTGSNVQGFKVGDEVFSRPDIARNGTYAEYIAVKADEVAIKPKTISFNEAASLPLAGITAWEALFDAANLQAEQKVLIHAASGGVGTLAVQLAKWKGAYVYATTSEKNIPFVTSLGADEVINYRDVNFKDVISGVDVVFDTVGDQVQEDSWSVLKPGGVLVSVVTPPSEERAQKEGVTAKFVFIQPNANILKQLADLVDRSSVRPVIAKEFALPDVKKAHELSESGRTVGKIVLHVTQP